MGGQTECRKERVWESELEKNSEREEEEEEEVSVALLKAQLGSLEM